MTRTPDNFGKGLAAKWVHDHANYTGDDCLPWPFSRDTNGRGHFAHIGLRFSAHRYMCELVNGPCPPGMECAHSCGNGRLGCVNPKHLSWQTRSENQMSRAAHGTAATSVDGPGGKLSLAQIEHIRSMTGKCPRLHLAREYGVHPNTIQRIQTGKTFGPKIVALTAKDLPLTDSERAIWKRLRRRESVYLKNREPEMGSPDPIIRRTAELAGELLRRRRAFA